MKEESESDLFTCQEREAHERIDTMLVKHYESRLSRAYFQLLISDGNVLVNGAPVKKRYCPAAGDLIEVQFSITEEIGVEAEEIALDILYEDQVMLAVNKPAGMVVHPAPGNWRGTFANALVFYCKQLAEEAGTSVRPGVVHRLDRDTSGVLLAAKSREVQHALMDLFAKRQVKKEYLAICLGNPGEGELSYAIARDPIHRKKMSVVKEGGRSAVTAYKTERYDHAVSLVHLKPLTGRTHQLRVHLKEIGAPILGDAVYGNPQANKRFKVKRQLLHAWKLTLPHPVTGEEIRIEAPLPEDFQAWVKRLE